LRGGGHSRAAKISVQRACAAADCVYQAKLNGMLGRLSTLDRAAMSAAVRLEVGPVASAELQLEDEAAQVGRAGSTFSSFWKVSAASLWRLKK